ncbi:hypothetical protein AC1031_015521 [Aphanomyces cochlioides]|nr:hypothetical protein AC1031_015521 [Aphanomyces cochlioides]
MSRPKSSGVAPTPVAAPAPPPKKEVKKDVDFFDLSKSRHRRNFIKALEPRGVSSHGRHTSKTIPGRYGVRKPKPWCLEYRLVGAPLDSTRAKFSGSAFKRCCLAVLTYVALALHMAPTMPKQEQEEESLTDSEPRWTKEDNQARLRHRSPTAATMDEEIFSDVATMGEDLEDDLMSIISSSTIEDNQDSDTDTDVIDDADDSLVLSDVATIGDDYEETTSNDSRWTLEDNDATLMADQP